MHPPSTTYLKYLDDTAILAFLTDNHSFLDYYDTVADLTQWRERNRLHLNVRKTKEIVIGTPSLQQLILINNKAFEMVDNFKYLGLTQDNKVSFDQQTKDIQKRRHRRLSAIRKFKGLYVAPYFLLLLYQRIVQPILLYTSTFFFNFSSLSQTGPN